MKKFVYKNTYMNKQSSDAILPFQYLKYSKKYLSEKVCVQKYLYE